MACGLIKEPGLAVKTAPSKCNFDWAGIRPIYQTLHSNLWRLTEPFGIKLDSELLRDLASLIAAMDVVDREVDAITAANARSQFADEVLSFLADQSQSIETGNSEPIVEYRLSELRDVIVRRQVQSALIDTVGAIFKQSEEKRQAPTVGHYVRSIEREWRLASELPLILMGSVAKWRFKSFFLDLAESMPIFDTLLDAKRDYRDGIMRFRPGAGLYATLAIRFATRVPVLILRFPSTLGLFRYATSVLLGAIRNKPPNRFEIQRSGRELKP